MWDQTRHAVEFFREHLPFAEMEADDELVRREGAWVFAKPGHVYAVYLPPAADDAPGAEPAKLWLPEAQFTLAWFNPRNGGTLRDGEVTALRGPGFRSLGVPPEDPDRDWVGLVRLDGPAPAELPPPPR